MYKGTSRAEKIGSTFDISPARTVLFMLMIDAGSTYSPTLNRMYAPIVVVKPMAPPFAVEKHGLSTNSTTISSGIIGDASTVLTLQCLKRK
jgi:hypothetical protein